MEQPLHYDTVVNAIEALKQRGFTIDFNVEEEYILHGSDRIPVDEFSIVDVYRYEGDSDPSDEAAVYAIESTSGLKGILVAGYGISANGSHIMALLEKLPRK